MRRETAELFTFRPDGHASGIESHYPKQTSLPLRRTRSAGRGDVGQSHARDQGRWRHADGGAAAGSPSALRVFDTTRRATGPSAWRRVAVATRRTSSGPRCSAGRSPTIRTDPAFAFGFGEAGSAFGFGATGFTRPRSGGTGRVRVGETLRNGAWPPSRLPSSSMCGPSSSERARTSRRSRGLPRRRTPLHSQGRSRAASDSRCADRRRVPWLTP